jgi:hypothetical protein
VTRLVVVVLVRSLETLPIYTCIRLPLRSTAQPLYTKFTIVLSSRLSKVVSGVTVWEVARGVRHLAVLVEGGRN